ncbi:hypothetical protein BOH78_3380 [Pichia kudriavzevii]
MLFHT